MGPQAFTALVRGTVPGWGGRRVWGRICGRIFAALTETEGVVVSCRRGLLRRWADELGDVQRTRAQLRRWRRIWSPCWPGPVFPGWRTSLA
jgi:hypothetical protein